jgi:hypothetical protein
MGGGLQCLRAEKMAGQNCRTRALHSANICNGGEKRGLRCGEIDRTVRESLRPSAHAPVRHVESDAQA